MLYVEESGVPGSPSIVFLHGVGTSGWMWQRQIAALTDFHCLNVDLPGHGKSSHVPWISLEDTADQLAEIIQARATNGQAHIVGLSLGGYVALILMLHRAELVQSAVISGVTVEPMPNRYLLKPQLVMMSILKRRWVANLQAKSLNLTLDEQAAFTENFGIMTIKTYRRIAEEITVFTVPSALESVNVPTLITAGGKETKIILQAVDVITNLMPHAQGWLAPNVGHGWNIEATALFNKMLRAWLTDATLLKRMPL